MTDATYVTRAQCEFDRRQVRYRYLPNVEFTDTSWDLILYLFTQQDRAIPTGEAGRYIAAPRTTVLRHMDVLEVAGMIERSVCVTDRRLTLVKLTEQAIQDVTAYLKVEIPVHH